MVYGKRTSKRIARRYTKSSISRPLSSDYHNVVCGFALSLNDNASAVVNVMEQMELYSLDWDHIKYMYSSFKVLKVVADYSPYLTAPTSLTDAAHGWVCLRDGFTSTPLGSAGANELARFSNTVAFNNMRPFTLTRRVRSGGWFSNSASPTNPEVPLILFYTALAQVASSNAQQKGSCRFRFYMLGKGSQYSK